MDLRELLASDLRAFLERAKAIGPSNSYDALEDACERLVDWTLSNSGVLVHRPSTGADPKVGVARGKKLPFVWRFYPRQDDGGKVTLLPTRASALRDDEWHRMVNAIRNAAPSLAFAREDSLDVGLPLLASDSAWQRFRPALEAAMNSSIARGDK